MDISSLAAVATASPWDRLGSGHYPGYIHSFRVLHGLDLVAGDGRGGAYGRASAVVSRPSQDEIRAAGLDQVGELAQAEHQPSSLAGLSVPEQKGGRHFKKTLQLLYLGSIRR